jgi:concanavalin A-like lectin/glucanase superfamily protein
MSAYSDHILSHGSQLVGYYRHGEASGTTMVDSSLTGNNGTYTTVTLGVTGHVANDSDTAVTFPGTSDAATIPDHNNLDFGDVFSIEFSLARITTGSASVQVVLNKTSGGPRLVWDTSDRLRMFLDGTAGFVWGTPAITDTAKHHYIFTKNGSTRKIYKDGVDVALLGTNVTFTNNAAAYRYGYLSAGVQRLNATMDELSFYNVELTPTDALYHFDLWNGTPVSISVPAAIANVSAPAAAVAVGLPAVPGVVSGASPAPADSIAVGAMPAAISADAPPPAVSSVTNVPAAPAQIDSDATPPAMAISSEILAAAASATVAGGNPTPAVGIGAVPASAAGDASAGSPATNIPSAPAPGDYNAVPPGYRIDAEVVVPPATTGGNTVPGAPSVTITATPAPSDVIAVPPTLEFTGDAIIVAPAAEATVVAMPPVVTIVSEPIPGAGGGGFVRRFADMPTRKDVTIEVNAARIYSAAVPPKIRAFQTELDDELIMLLFTDG